jgi:hypothetical protein
MLYIPQTKSLRKNSPDLTAGSASGDSLIALAVSPLSSDTLYAGSSDVLVHVTTNALSGSSATWTNITGSGSLPNRSITALAADPYSATTAYCHVLRLHRIRR